MMSCQLCGLLDVPPDHECPLQALKNTAHDLRTRLTTAEAELARVNGMRCETCKHASHGDIDLWCEKWSRAWTSARDVMCADIKGCLAWEKRDA